MELILVRHALPVRRENTSGPADPELSPEGVAQAELFARHMAQESLDALYSSPMRRAVQTAEPLATALSMPTLIVDGVAEFDQHANEYIPVEELKANNDPRWRDIVNGQWSEIEDQGAFVSRVIDSLEGIIERHRGDRVLVTCHGGVINAYLSHVLGLEFRHFFYPNYTSIHRVAASSSGHRSILAINETTHLRGSGLPMGLFDA